MGRCDAHAFTYLNLFGDGVHNLIDGMIIAASFLTGLRLGVATTIAVAAHEIPQELGDFGIHVYGGFSKTRAILYNLATALVCMGGALTVLAAVYVREVDAASCWYGVPPEQAADARTIAIPFQGHFARQDQVFTPSQVEAFEAKLKEGKVKYELYWYDANHAFGNEKGHFYNAEAAKLAWQRSGDFFARHLK